MLKTTGASAEKKEIAAVSTQKVLVVFGPRQSINPNMSFSAKHIHSEFH